MPILEGFVNKLNNFNGAMMIDKIGSGGIKPNRIIETTKIEKNDSVQIKEKDFKQILGTASESNVTESNLESSIKEISQKLSSGEITNEQAIDLIVSAFREEIKGTPDVEAKIQFIKEVLSDDPTIELLLKGK